MRLKELPVQMDIEKIARGLLDLFTEEERDLLRFGLLPATNMEILKKELEDKFRSLGGGFAEGDALCAVTTIPGRRHIEFSMKRLVDEAMHEIALELYRIGDLVV